MKAYKFTRNIVFGMISLIGVFLLLLWVKTSYIYDVHFPLNIDSVNHAYFIDQILAGYGQQTYYHYGFHYISIFISQLSGENIPKTMLLFGQILQLMIPFIIFLPVQKITNDSRVALFCILVSGLGFNMPSISSSWGKYPALLGIMSSCYLIFVLVDAIKQTNLSPIKWMFTAVVMTVSVLIHTRMLILVTSILLALLVDKIVKVDDKRKGLIMGLSLMIFLISMFNENISSQPVGIAWQPFHEPRIVFLLFIFTIPFSALYFGRYTFQSGLMIFFLLLFFLTPTPYFFASNYNAPTFIDRPFLSMSLFVPVCTLFGSGLAGALKWTAKQGSHKTAAVTIMLLGVVFLFPNLKILKPLPNAVMAGKDDTYLYEDIKNHLEEDAKILIPNFPGYYYDRGVDGGAWVPYVTNRAIQTTRYDSDISSCVVIREVCAAGARYIYVGSKPYSFSVSELDLKNSLYQPLFEYPEAKLYRITGCFICQD